MAGARVSSGQPLVGRCAEYPLDSLRNLKAQYVGLSHVHLRLRRITEAFPNEVCVDFDSLGEGLIAIVGENGAGKSSLIESVFAALVRQLPGQKRSLYDFATHPQPEIDLTFSVNGARCRSLLKIDPKSRQMESYLLNGERFPAALLVLGRHGCLPHAGQLSVGAVPTAGSPAGRQASSFGCGKHGAGEGVLHFEAQAGLRRARGGLLRPG